MESKTYSSILEKHKAKVAARLWNLEIPNTNPKGPSEGHEFGKEVLRYLKLLGLKKKGVFK